ncbi:LytR C-terminal domain-containing protein [Actinophytocola sp.]|uniref:LytR C-terminal domain-containing protein n=1 Tax=Actinophytocola sp. TaxID=1872138 RepID=UPI002D7F17A0|nr:LytR C-terminal domain-containing protein [Actinophytocola sp.]HET9141055.1 LytR C-terminal domain-containing protein [Actinophytocola sp.]
MSAVVDPGSARPGRIVGLVLIGIAVLAAILGILTLIDGGNGGEQGQPTNQPSQPGSPPSGAPSSGVPTSGAPTSGAPTSGTPTNPPPAQPPASQPPPATAAPPAPAPANPRSVPVRVYNNSTITGLANEAANDFRADGWNVVEVGNYNQGTIPTSTAYFTPGTDEEAAAKELGGKFNLRVEPRFPGIISSSPGVIVIVTKDYGGK